MKNNSKKRVIYLDILRAFAVLMMVQGHTVDALLSDTYRSSDYVLYSIWLTMRGFTAPIFMFTSGIVFTYLLLQVKKPFLENERVKKGFKRFLLLLGIGYLLRYPTYSFVDFSSVTAIQWEIFFTVDALHLIAFGILFILIFYFISSYFRLSEILVFASAALLFILPAQFMESVNWNNILPAPIASYLYSKSGSYFPLFPWVGYVLAGGVLGSILAFSPGIFRQESFKNNLALLGSGSIIFVFVWNYLDILLGFSYFLNFSVIQLFFLRLGFVLLLNSLVSYLASILNSIPQMVPIIGRYTLPIYVFHLIILYGSAWTPGLAVYYGKTFDAYFTIIAAVLMISTMILLVFLLNNKYYPKLKTKLFSVIRVRY